MTTQLAQTRWTEGKRSDGLAIVPGIDGLVIMPAGERLPVAECPCCGKPFLNIRAGTACRRHDVSDGEG